VYIYIYYDDAALGAFVDKPNLDKTRQGKARQGSALGVGVNCLQTKHEQNKNKGM
jgi:hypothetical protein